MHHLCKPVLNFTAQGCRARALRSITHAATRASASTSHTRQATPIPANPATPYATSLHMSNSHLRQPFSPSRACHSPSKISPSDITPQIASELREKTLQILAKNGYDTDLISDISNGITPPTVILPSTYPTDPNCAIAKYATHATTTYQDDGNLIANGAMDYTGLVLNKETLSHINKILDPYTSQTSPFEDKAVDLGNNHVIIVGVQVDDTILFDWTHNESGAELCLANDGPPTGHLAINSHTGSWTYIPTSDTETPAKWFYGKGTFLDTHTTHIVEANEPFPTTLWDGHYYINKADIPRIKASLDFLLKEGVTDDCLGALNNLYNSTSQAEFDTHRKSEHFKAYTMCRWLHDRPFVMQHLIEKNEININHYGVVIQFQFELYKTQTPELFSDPESAKNYTDLLMRHISGCQQLTPLVQALFQSD